MSRERHPVVGAVLASIVLSPVAGYVALGRRQRAIVLAAAELGYLTLAVAAALGGIVWLMGAAVLAACAHLMAALVDIARLARSTGRAGRRWGLAIPVAVAFALGFQGMGYGVRAQVLASFRSPSGTMLPTIASGDSFLVDKRAASPSRGEVVVFRYPPEPATPFAVRVKRVVAVGGDTVQVREGHLLVNGEPVPTRRLASGDHDEWEETLDGRSYHVLLTPGRYGSAGSTTVPADHVYVLGDNRDDNNDSRVYGAMPVASVIGRATAIWWSRAPGSGVRWNRIGQRF
jgi:signal peptidase I